MTKPTFEHYKFIVIPLILEQLQKCHVFVNHRTSTCPAGFEKYEKNEKLESNATAVRTGILSKCATGAGFCSILELKERHRVSRLDSAHNAVSK